MQIICCKACGKRYDYLTQGCCPKCGAYNRPPRREWVDPDGSVRTEPRQTSAQPKPGKVCYEHKSTTTKAKSAPKVSVHTPLTKKSSKKSSGAIGVIIFAVVMVLSFVFNSGILDGDIGTGSDVAFDNVSCGESVSWDDGEMTVYGYLRDEDGSLYVALDQDVEYISSWWDATLYTDAEEGFYTAVDCDGCSICFGEVEPGNYSLDLFIDDVQITVDELVNIRQ